MRAIEQISTLREKTQGPYRRFNDIGGLLYGDWLSTYVTWLFLKLGIGPTAASLSMIACGVLGFVLLPFDGGWAVAGCLLMMAFYIFDCVDGEVARYHGVERYIWTFYDFFCDVCIKSAFFVSVGLHAMIHSGQGWAMLLGVVPALAMLFKKFLDLAPIFLTAQQVLMRFPREREVILRDLAPDPSETDKAAGRAQTPEQPASRRETIQRHGSAIGILRTILVNFHLAVIVFLFAAVLDLNLAAPALFGQAVSFKTLALALYAASFSYDFVDRMIAATKHGRFMQNSRAFVEAAHKFRLDD